MDGDSVATLHSLLLVGLVSFGVGYLASFLDRKLRKRRKRRERNSEPKG